MARKNVCPMRSSRSNSLNPLAVNSRLAALSANISSLFWFVPSRESRYRRRCWYNFYVYDYEYCCSTVPWTTDDRGR